MGTGASSQASAGDAGAPKPATDTPTFRTYKELLNKGNILDYYRKCELLGSGNMASVFRYVRKNDGVALAAKVVAKSSLSELSEFTNELEILAYCGGHKHILDLYDIFEDAENFYLLTDLLEGGELFDRICEMGVYNEAIAKSLISPILDALHHVHSLSVLHRDVKPENLLLMDNNANALLKIADFGVAAWLPELQKLKYPKCGTPEYLAPEMYGPRNCPYGKPVDVWALGCVVFIMLCGWHPFQDPESMRKQKEEILKGNISELDDEDITPDAKDFIKKMLIVNPEQRYTIEQLQSHAWLQDPTQKQVATAQSKPLVKTQQKIKTFLGKRLRKVVLGMAFANGLRTKKTVAKALKENIGIE